MSRVNRYLAFALALVALPALLAGAAAARSSTHVSTVIFRSYSNSSGTFLASGVIQSSRKCIGGRKVKIYIADHASGPFSEVDTDRSSTNGIWAGSGELGPSTAFLKAKAVESKYGPKRHRQTCGADDEVFSLSG